MKIVCPHQQECVICGDRLIHQWNRGNHESSSAFGQFVHDRVTRRTTFGDVDMELFEDHVYQLHFGAGPQRLRLLEHKPQGNNGGLRQGQRWLLECVRYLIGLGLAERCLAADSGVYVIEGDPPFETVTVHRLPAVSGANGDRVTWDQDQLIKWLGGPR